MCVTARSGRGWCERDDAGRGSIMRRLTLLTPVAALLLAGSVVDPLLAQALPGLDLACLLSEDLAWLLREQYAEVPVARGVGEDGTLVTVFAAKTTGTWRIALTDPTGVSCVIAEGTGFELLPQELALQGDPGAT
jgi:hypothetical protein